MKFKIDANEKKIKMRNPFDLAASHELATWFRYLLTNFGHLPHGLDFDWSIQDRNFQ